MVKVSPNQNTKSSGDSKTNRIQGQLISVLCISIGHFLDGTVLAYTSTAIPSMTNSTEFDFHHMTYVRSFHSLGATVACLCAGLAMSTFGRRGSTMGLTIPAYLIGYILIGTAQNIIMVIAGRFITGVGLGLTLCIPTVYIVEISSSNHRGVLGVIPNLFCQLGILSTYIAGYWLDWSLLALAISLVCVPFGIGVWWIPESPVFLLENGKVKETERVLQVLDREIWDQDLPVFVEDLNEVKKFKKFSSVISNPANCKPFLCGITLMVFFQTTGYPTLIGSTVELFLRADQTMTSEVASIVIGIVIVISALISIPLAKKFNPKSMLIFSALGVSVCLFVFGSYCYFENTSVMNGLAWLPLVTFILYVGFFINGYGGASWLIFAEILPPMIRTTAYPIGISFTWFVNFILTFAYNAMILDIGYFGTLWFYASVTTASIFFIALCLPNTKNKSYSEIADFFK